MPNASRRSTNDFDVKECSRMITRFNRECAVFSPTHLLRNSRERRPSNECDLESSVTWYIPEKRGNLESGTSAKNLDQLLSPL